LSLLLWLVLLGLTALLAYGLYAVL